MNELQKYFRQGVDGLLDDAVKAVVKPIEETLEFAEFLVFVMSMGIRRLKALFVPEEMTEEEKAMPEFKFENMPLMTDEEIWVAFGSLSPMDKAKFVMSVRKADGPVAIRFNALLEQMKAGEQAIRAENQAAIVRRAQEEADRARKAADEAETKRVRRDDEAMAFIAKAPEGRFQAMADFDGLIKPGENGDEIFDWVHRKMILVGDAMVLGLCLITDKATAERLAEKLRRPKDKNRPLAYSIAATRDFLVQRQKENEAARTRKAEEERAAKERETVERGDFTTKVRGAFALTLNIPDKERVRNRLKTEAGGESWKLDIVRTEAEAREQGIFVNFRQELRERFPHFSASSELDAFIKEMEAEFFGRASDEGWSENVIRGAERHINMIRRHRQWLEDHPAGVRQAAPQAAIINFADRWESSSSARRERPKFGPGSGIGGRKREKTQEELMVHRGRQIALADQKYWSGKFNKPVEKFTDDDFKKVVELFGEVKGDRKAAKKQGKQGGRN